MKTGVRSSRPCVHITPRDVIACCKDRPQEPTLDQAKSWLSKNRRQLERQLRSIIKERMQDILAVMLWDEYFDPALNEQFFAVDAAIAAALGGRGTDENLCQELPDVELFGELDAHRGPGAAPVFVKIALFEISGFA